MSTFIGVMAWLAICGAASLGLPRSGLATLGTRIAADLRPAGHPRYSRNIKTRTESSGWTETTYNSVGPWPLLPNGQVNRKR